MKLKGFTLIETIVSIFILTLLFGVTTSVISFKNNIEKDIEYDESIYEIQNLLILSKIKCREENDKGQVLMNKRQGELYFYDYVNGGNLIKKVTIPKEFKFIGTNNNLYLNKKGRFTTGDTLTLISSNNELNSITIGVGVDTIRIKE